MSRRNGRRLDRRNHNTRAVSSYVDPAVTYGASVAWRAEDASSSAGKTTQWNPYVGAVTLSTLVGAIQPGQAATQATLGNRLGVPHVATGYYSGTVAAATAHTLVFIGRLAASAVGMCAVTDTGTTNSGTSLSSFTNITYARRPGFVDASFAQAVPVSGVWVATFTTAGCSLYFNSGTATTSAVASAAFNFTTFALGGLDGTGALYGLNGAACLSAYFTRALSPSEVAAAMQTWCTRYGQVYTP